MNTDARVAQRWETAVQRMGAIIAGLIGVLGLISWMQWLPGLHDLVPQLSPLSPAAAIMLTAMAGVVSTQRQLAGRWVALIILFFCVSAAFRHATGLTLPWDPLPFPGVAALRPHQTGGLAPAAALVCTLFALVLWLRPVRPAHPLVAASLGSIFAIGALSLISILEGIDRPGLLGRFELITLPATIGYFGVASGLLASVRGLSTLRQQRASTAIGSLTVSLVLIVGVSLGAWRSNALQSETKARVIRAYEVIEAVNYLELCLTRMESAARAYSLGGQEVFRGQYDRVRSVLNQRRGLLSDLLRHDPEQQSRQRKLDDLVARKIAFMDAVIAATAAGRIEFRRENFQDQQGPDLMAEVQQTVNAIDRGSRTRLATDILIFEQAADTTGRVILLVAVLSLVFGGYSLRVWRVADRMRDTAERQLRESNDTLDRRVHERTRDLHDAVASLAQAEARYRQVTETLPQLVWTCAPDGRCDWLGPQWVAYTGIPAAGQLGYGWTEQLHPDDREPTTQAWAVASSAKALFDVEFRLRRHDGEYRWFKTRAVPLRDPTGAIVRWFGTNTDIHEQKLLSTELERRVQERTTELATANRLQRAVLDGTVHSIISTTPEGVIVSFNAGAERTLGYPRAEVVGRETPALFHDPVEIAARAAELSAELGRPVAPGFEAFVARTLEGGVDEREWTYLRRDGSRLPVWLSVTALRDETGTITGFLGIAQDLTERKQAQRALAASELRMRLFAAHAPAAVAMFDRDMHYLVVSQRWVKDYGLEGREIIGRSHYEVFPEIGEHWKDIHRRCLAGAVEVNEADAFDRADGSRQWLSWRVQPWHEPDGAIGGLVMFTADITEQMRIREELRTSREQLATIFNSMAEGLVLQDSTGRITNCNPAAERILGVPLDQLTGRNALDPSWRLVGPDGKPLPDERRPTFITLRPGEPQREVEIGVDRPDGSRIWISVNTEPMLNPVGTAPAAIVSFTDITERKQLLDSLARARDAALEASRLKSEFLANMSHEIRTPMNGVIGMADMLLGTPLTTTQREMARVVQSSAESLLTIINDILDFSKVEAGKLHIESGEFSLRQVAEEVVALLAPRAQLKGVEMICDWERDLPAGLRGDAVRIRQVLMNLLGNAVKFTDAGEVCVEVRRTAETAASLRFRVSVRDTGIGIAPEFQTRLFEAFVQGDGSTTRRFGGTGLGLAISRQLVQLMGGEIGFTSAPGRGSVFWFELDLPKLARPPAPPPTTLPRNLRVLVVDDNVTNRRILHGQLAELGERLELAADAGAALDLLRLRHDEDRPFDVALLDWHMPGRDGLTLARDIRADPRHAGLRLVMLSSSGETLKPGTASELRFFALLNKPVRESELRTLILRAATGAPEAVAGGAAQPVAGGGIHLLVAEDNPANQLVVRRVLESLGHTCEIVGDGAAALARLAEARFAAVLMDCQMPVMDGYTATRQIRAGAVPGLDSRLPIIALTAYAMPDDRRKCTAAGMDDYVTKPLRSDALRAALGRCGIQTTAVAPAAVPVTVDPGVLDPLQVSQLREMPGSQHPTLWGDLVEMFLRETPEVLRQLALLEEQRAADDYAMLAHRLAGGSATLGGPAFRTAALAQEKSARAGRWDEIAGRNRELDREWERLRYALENPPA